VPAGLAANLRKVAESVTPSSPEVNCCSTAEERRDAALVETERSFPLQTEVMLETELPKVTRAIRAAGRVVRHAGGHDGAQAMAILFDEVSAEVALRIDLFVCEQEV
jgi:hypothetical protein